MSIYAYFQFGEHGFMEKYAVSLILIRHLCQIHAAVDNLRSIIDTVVHHVSLFQNSILCIAYTLRLKRVLEVCEISMHPRLFWKLLWPLNLTNMHITWKGICFAAYFSYGEIDFARKVCKLPIVCKWMGVLLIGLVGENNPHALYKN